MKNQHNQLIFRGRGFHFKPFLIQLVPCVWTIVHTPKINCNHKIVPWFFLQGFKPLFSKSKQQKLRKIKNCHCQMSKRFDATDRCDARRCQCSLTLLPKRYKLRYYKFELFSWLTKLMDSDVTHWHFNLVRLCFSTDLNENVTTVYKKSNLVWLTDLRRCCQFTHSVANTMQITHTLLYRVVYLFSNCVVFFDRDTGCLNWK